MADINHTSIVVFAAAEQTETVRRSFHTIPVDLRTRLKLQMQTYAKKIGLVYNVERIVLPQSPEDFGHAAACACYKASHGDTAYHFV